MLVKLCRAFGWRPSCELGFRKVLDSLGHGFKVRQSVINASLWMILQPFLKLWLPEIASAKQNRTLQRYSGIDTDERAL